MIEPPKTIGDCRRIYNAAGLRVDELMDMQFFPNAEKLAEVLNELEALRALVSELADCRATNYEDRNCAICGAKMHTPHEADCLISRAREAMKICIA
jgi:hypothetical protein